MNGLPVRLPPFRVEATLLQLSETIDWGLTAYRVPDQWRTTRGRGVKVAVLDTGIDLGHPDLASAVDEAIDFTGSRFGPADRNGHGTHTAGTIAARENQLGVVGIAPDCRLLVAKVLGDDGAGQSDWVAAGIDWACDRGAQVINMSLGSPQPDGRMKAALERAAAKGVLVVAAAGNEGLDSSVNYPARWPTTIAVAAVDRHGRLAEFSSRGDEVAIAAPGQDVLSTYLHASYAKLSGTSMAAPFVAGVTALLLAAPGESRAVSHVEQLRRLLQQTAVDAGPVGKDPGYGWGLIDPAALIASATAPMGPTPGEWILGGITVNGREGFLVFQPR